MHNIELHLYNTVSLFKILITNIQLKKDKIIWFEQIILEILNWIILY